MLQAGAQGGIMFRYSFEVPPSTQAEIEKLSQELGIPIEAVFLRGLELLREKVANSKKLQPAPINLDRYGRLSYQEDLTPVQAVLQEASLTAYHTGGRVQSHCGLIDDDPNLW